MKKLVGFLLVGGAIVGLLMALRQKMAAADRTEFFAKLQKKMEEMPEDFPPKVMFNNVAATRKNTERILELMEKEEVKEPEAVAS